jgi:hypothetical protein
MIPMVIDTYSKGILGRTDHTERKRKYKLCIVKHFLPWKLFAGIIAIAIMLSGCTPVM